MGVIVFLIGCGVAFAGGFLMLFLWATRTGQYDDIHTPAIRVLFDDRESQRMIEHPQSTTSL